MAWPTRLLREEHGEGGRPPGSPSIAWAQATSHARGGYAPGTTAAALSGAYGAGRVPRRHLRSATCPVPGTGQGRGRLESRRGQVPRGDERAGRARVRGVAAVRRDRGLLRRRDAAAARGALLPPGGRGAEPRDDARAVPARLRPRGRDPGRRGAADVVRERDRAGRARARAGEARHRADQRARRPRARGGRPRRRAVHALVPAGAA